MNKPYVEFVHLSGFKYQVKVDGIIVGFGNLRSCKDFFDELKQDATKAAALRNDFIVDEVICK
jgi:hypothetical protein